MTDTIIEENVNNIIRTDEEPIIISEDINNIIVDDSSSDLVIVEDEVVSIITVAEQGPAGPPAGIGTEIENLPFIGSGAGQYKTNTGYYNNIIYEEFGLLDELFVLWRFSDGLDKSKDIIFSGGFFPTTDGVNRSSKWEVHVTSVGSNGQVAYTDVVDIPEYPIPDTAYSINLGQAVISHVDFHFDETEVIHIRLKRIPSSNDDGTVAVAGLAVSYTTDGKVGEQGPPGPSGDEELPYAKLIDAIDDDHMYIGEADPGTLEGAATWRIKYISFIGDDASIRWANGTGAFDKIWANRFAYTYL